MYISEIFSNLSKQLDLQESYSNEFNLDKPIKFISTSCHIDTSHQEHIIDERIHSGMHWLIQRIQDQEDRHSFIKTKPNQIGIEAN